MTNKEDEELNRRIEAYMPFARMLKLLERTGGADAMPSLSLARDPYGEDQRYVPYSAIYPRDPKIGDWQPLTEEERLGEEWEFNRKRPGELYRHMLDALLRWGSRDQPAPFPFDKRNRTI
jgi:hypothetical protein